MLQRISSLVACAAFIVTGAQHLDVANKANVLVVYAEDPNDQIKGLATLIADGAQRSGADARVVMVDEANYKRDVYEWADAVILGSPVYNGNPTPSLLTFVDSFNFQDKLSSKVGGAFATGGAAAAGLGPVLLQLRQSLETFGMITVGGTNWRNSHGTGTVTNGSRPIDTEGHDAALARDQGARIAQLAAVLKQASPKATTTPSPPSINEPPSWGETWSASVSASMNTVGYDAGLVVVNFTGQCTKPSTQRMRSVYEDLSTVLTRCDLGREFIIDPPSRGGRCRSRAIGKDVDARICQACSCPFCVRDTQGAFTHGEQYPSRTQWQSKERMELFGRDVVVWKGVAVSSTERNGGQAYALSTSIAYSADDVESASPTPIFVNVTHPLWYQTEARLDRFSRSIDVSDFDIPGACFRTEAERSVIV